VSKKETSMSKNQPTQTSASRTGRKFFVSSFVVVTFIVYALFFGAPAGGISTAIPQPTAAQHAPPSVAQVAAATAPPPPQPTATTAPLAVQPLPTDQPATDQPAPTAQPVPTTQPTPVPVVQAKGQYTDGEYSGPVTDAYYGNMQVKAVIQAGKISDVQILEYPNDRRTSVRINSIALPYLINEAIQVQSANVDVISGATLTSEAFAQSLQVALGSARASS
jgi:uncharacterized protein with FMN-binding domain